MTLHFRMRNEPEQSPPFLLSNKQINITQIQRRFLNVIMQFQHSDRYYLQDCFYFVGEKLLNFE
jgi:hypothetical protein